MAAGPLPAQTAMKWSAVLSVKLAQFWAWGTAGLFVSLASFDYQRLSLWHRAHSWKRLSECEWDDSDRNVTQKYLGTSHILADVGKLISKMSGKHKSVFFFKFIQRVIERAGERVERSSNL